MRHTGQTRRPTAKRVAIFFSLLAGIVALAAAASASAERRAVPRGSVHGAVFTTVNQTVDGTGHCLNGGELVNCNHYDGKQFVWVNGGPAANKLRPAGQYFFAVGEPGFQSHPNDGSDGNLSCAALGCADPYTNRTFTVGSNGEITSYAGTHQQSPGSGGLLLRLCLAGCPPYLDTTNPGGVYKMAVCYLGTGKGAGGGGGGPTYPVDANDCKYDSFKVEAAVDTGPPICTLIATIPGPPKQIQVLTQDADSGLASIDVLHSVNANTVVPPFAPGTTAPVVVNSTKIDQTKFSTLALRVTDMAGNVTECDPVVPGTPRLAHKAKAARLSSAAHQLARLRRGA